MVISYDGTDFQGSQHQPGKRTVEGELATTLTRFYPNQVKLNFSGRTDSGVHASGQVVSFVPTFGIPVERLQGALNRKLPGDIRVHAVTTIPGRFDARRDAIERTYEYWIADSDVPAGLARFVAPPVLNIDLDVFAEFRARILGKHDFRAFRKTGSAERTTVRSVFECKLESVELPMIGGGTYRFWRITITANAFLYRMVRNLVGVLRALWQNTMNLSQLQEMLSASAGGSYPYTVAEARGLHLVNVKY